MPKKYSKVDIEGLFQIKKTRIQEWLDQNFIEVSEPAQGKGTINLFSLNDLYHISLFIKLLSSGFTRKFAKEGAYKASFKNVGEKQNQYKFLYCISKIVDPPLREDVSWKVDKKQPTINIDADLSLFIMNLIGVKREVGDRLK
jgi:hypothetical protein